MPNTKLLLAAENGSVTDIRAQMCRGANVNTKRTSDGATPLIIAAGKGWLECVQILIKYGADIHAEDKCGATALTAAVLVGQLAMISELMKNGAHLRMPRPRGGILKYSSARV